MLIIDIALLLIVANGSPVMAAKMLGHLAAWPIDAGRTWTDGRPLFGVNKTWRGLISSLLCTVLAGWFLGLGWLPGFVVAGGAMAGDLASSFTKRRLGLAASARAVGLDHLPESLLPALLLYLLFDYSWLVLLSAAGLFVVADVLISPLLFRWGLRRAPH